MTTDASSTGWGAVLKDEKGTILSSAAGHWTQPQMRKSNLLELTSVRMAIEAFDLKKANILHLSDNTPTVRYTNKVYGRVERLNSEAHQLFNLVMKRNIRLRSAHVPGIDNVMADFQSSLNPKLEWTTPAPWFNLAVQEFGMLVDIFASPRTKQSKYYMVWKGKKKGFCLGDGLLNAWPKRVWVVPPIRLLNLIPRLLTKWRPEIAVIITPDWQAQPWYQALRAMPELRSTILRRIVPRAALPNHTKRLRTWIVSFVQENLSE